MKKVLVLLSIICTLSACGGVQKSDEALIGEYLSQAEEYMKQKEYNFAERSFVEAIELSEKVYGTESKEVADIYLELSVNNKNYKKALDNAANAEKIYEKYNDNVGLARTFCSYGDIYINFSETELAKNAYEKALHYCDMSEDAQGKLKFDIYLNLFNTETDFEKVLYYFQEAEPLMEKGTDSEKIWLYVGMGNTYFNESMAKEAAVCYENAISIWKVLENKEDIKKNQLDIARSYDFCAFCYISIDKYEKGIEYINASLEILKNVEDANILDYALPYRHLSVAYLGLEVPDYEKVLEYGLKSCQVYFDKKSELSIKELEDLKTLEDVFESLYEETPYAKEKDFETWYKENIDK